MPMISIGSLWRFLHVRMLFASTIYREIRRNTFHDRELPQYGGYFSTFRNYSSGATQ